MHPAIAQHTAEIDEICRHHRIRRLDIFGSAARAEDFDAIRSDADFLVEFEPDVLVELATFFNVKAELEKLLGRDVDLVEAGAIRNPFVLEGVYCHLESVYKA
ncbi:MAG: polymerase subunit beta [Variovorax sp.]|nr:polymerase subunit beta [Variovorax sp.]